MPGRFFPAGHCFASSLANCAMPKAAVDFIHAVVVAQLHHIIAVGMTLVAVPGQAGHPMRAQQA